MTATVTGGATATASPVPAATIPRRRRARFPRASSTPGKVRLIRAGAFTGLEAGTAVLALVMAAGCAWGLSKRLAEYR